MKNLVKNYIYNVVYQIVSLITPLITAPYISRTLGAEMIGINNYVYSIVDWFLLFGVLGIRMYGGKEIAKCSNDIDKRTKIFNEIFSMQLFSLAIITLLYLTYLIIFVPEYITFFIIYIITIIGVTFDISWFYVGIEDFKKITIRDLIVKILNIITMFIFIKEPNDLVIYVIITNAFYFFSQLIMWISIKKHINFIKVTFNNLNNHFFGNIGLFIPQIASSVTTILNQSMLGMISPKIEDVAYYGYAQKFVTMFLFVTTSIGSVMMPRVSRITVESGKEKAKDYIRKTFAISLFLSYPMAFGLAIISPYVIPWFLTEQFIDTSYLIMILSVTIIFISLSNVLGVQYLIPTERTKEYTKSVIFGVILGFIANLIFIPYFRSYGAAISAVITEFTVFMFQYKYVKSDQLLINIRRNSIKYLIVSMFMFGLMYLIGSVMGIGILTAIVQFVFGSAFYFIVMYLLNDEIILMFLDYIKTYLSKYKKARNS